MSTNATKPSSSQDEAMRQRTITHMNKDHATSLSLFLQHYSRLPASSFTDPELVEITTSHMIIKSSAGRNLIPLDPPMTSLSECRGRMVEMHNASLNGLGLSTLQVTRFQLPSALWQWAVHGVVLWCVFTLPFPALCDPQSGSWVSRVYSFGGLVPGVAWLASRIGVFTWWFILVVHSAEAVFMATGRLRKYRVPKGSVWWCWLTAAFTGGVATFREFDAHVEHLQELERQKKH